MYLFEIKKKLPLSAHGSHGIRGVHMEFLLGNRREAYMVATVVTHGHVWFGLYIEALPEGLSHMTDNWPLFST